MKFSLDTSGTALVEFAITLPLLLVLALGIADYGLLMNNSTVVEATARAAAEIAKSNPNISQSDMTALYPDVTINAGVCKCIDGTAVAPCPPAPGTAPCATNTNPNTGLADSRILEYITVTATDSFSAWAPWPSFGAFPASLTSSAVARIQ
jgi:Flp pilus assembly protein TadG